MASIKKYNGSSFENAAIRKYSIATDTLTTLPSNLYADGNLATVGLVGNMQQTGAPTPQNPISPSETGEMTGNLCDEDNLNQGYYNNTPPFAFNGDNRYRCFSLSLTAGTYSILVYGSNIPMRLMRVSSNSLGIGTVSTDNEPYTFDLTVSETVYISFRNTDTSTDFTGLTVMMNAGNTVLPYEPYGQYKIPILSNSTTTNVYLGEMQTTRKIKKLVFTGQENWQRQTYEHTNIINLFLAIDNAMGNSPIYSNIVTYYSDAGITNDSRANVGKVNSTGFNLLIDLSLSDFSSIDTFKIYLRQQYAAGTPVTVWYVLATETTGIVNEPLRKIGDYADTVSGISIPTITGKDSFDVLTTLKPYEVSLAYTGWHDATVKEWDGSEWQ